MIEDLAGNVRFHSKSTAVERKMQPETSAPFDLLAVCSETAASNAAAAQQATSSSRREGQLVKHASGHISGVQEAQSM